MTISKRTGRALYEITVIHRFTASHRLLCPGEGWEDLHEHAWRVEASARRPGVDDAGMAIDFRFFKAILEKVISKVDGRCLNETPPFDTLPPSAENVARYIFDILQERLGTSADLHRVVVWEAADCAAAYIGEKE